MGEHVFGSGLGVVCTRVDVLGSFWSWLVEEDLFHATLRFLFQLAERKAARSILGIWGCSCEAMWFKTAAPPRATRHIALRARSWRVPVLRLISILRFWISEVWLKQNLNLKGWDSHVHREFPGKPESSNLSMDIIISRAIGRSCAANRGERVPPLPKPAGAAA